MAIRDKGSLDRQSSFQELGSFLIAGKFQFFIHMCSMEHTFRRPGCNVKATHIPSMENSVPEDYIMQRAHRYLSLLFLAAVLLSPAAAMANPGNQDGSRYDNDHVRYYDRDHRDYHSWDDREDRAYRRYLVAQHRSYRKFNRASNRVHRHYWNWRHSHPDND